MQIIPVQIGKFKMTYILAVTTAPPAYDGFGTFTVRELGPNENKPGLTDRLIMIQEGILGWQTQRNSSGLHPTWTEPEDCPYCDGYTAEQVKNILFKKMTGLE